MVRPKNVLLKLFFRCWKLTLKILTLFDSYFWPFNKSYVKSMPFFVISSITALIWNVFYKIILTWWNLNVSTYINKSLMKLHYIEKSIQAISTYWWWPIVSNLFQQMGNNTVSRSKPVIMLLFNKNTGFSTSKMPAQAKEK